MVFAVKDKDKSSYMKFQNIETKNKFTSWNRMNAISRKKKKTHILYLTNFKIYQINLKYQKFLEIYEAQILFE